MNGKHALFIVFIIIGIQGSVSPQLQLTSFSKRLFSRSGFHEVEGPKLGSPSPPPPPAAVRYPQPTQPAFSTRSSFFPSKASRPHHQPIVSHSRRRLPPDYNTDIITINDILSESRPKGSSNNRLKKNNEWIRTVGSSIHVRADDRRIIKGKVFDDVIYGYRSNFGKK